MRTQTLEGLREQFERADSDKGSIRYRARALAGVLGVEVPEWARPKARARRAAAPRERPASSSKPTPRRPSDYPPAQPVLFAPELRRWREAGEGRTINRHGDGAISLIEFRAPSDHRQVTFADERTAVRALVLGVGIAWRPLAPQKRSA